MSEVIFITGSESIRKIEGKIEWTVSNMIFRHHTLVIGDTNAFDKALIQFLKERNYHKVTLVTEGLPSLDFMLHQQEHGLWNRWYVAEKDGIDTRTNLIQTVLKSGNITRPCVFWDHSDDFRQYKELFEKYNAYASRYSTKENKLFQTSVISAAKP